ncbi:MAG: hypothetical protein IPP67_03715 [Rhodospirillaceae bacterium]|nr:hypothetical protein [Rhodospirillaceae bacterium]
MALGQLGAITCAEIARMPLDDASPNSGRLFVGGEFGVAVFVQGFNGKGWDTRINKGLNKFSSSAASASFPRGKNWRFLRLMKLADDGTTENIFKDVRRIISDQHNFYTF